METLTTQTSPVILSAEAVEELKKIKTEQDIANDMMLRIGVKGGGCAGFSYILGFDSKKENDEEYVFEDMPVIIDKSHLMYLAGMQLDYHIGLNNRGFVFENPNATKTCGCGTSFSA